MADLAQSVEVAETIIAERERCIAAARSKIGPSSGPDWRQGIQAAIEAMETDDKSDALSRLRLAIIGNTRGDLFWLGEILLAELAKETGFNG